MIHIRFTTAKYLVIGAFLLASGKSWGQLTQEQEQTLNRSLEKIEHNLLNRDPGMARVNDLIDPMMALGKLGITLDAIPQQNETEQPQDARKTRSRDSGGRMERPSGTHSRSSLLDQRVEALKGRTKDMEALLAPFLSEMEEQVAPATTERMDNYEFWNRIKALHGALTAFDVFCNVSSTAAVVNQSKAIYEATRSKRIELFSSYTAGNFHQDAGSGIYLTQNDHISPEGLSAADTTSHILIDGKKPVHIYILTDFPVELYSDSPLGCFVQCALTNPEDGQYSSDYIVDGKAAVPVTSSGKAYTKLTLVPSGTWDDFANQFAPSQFYNGNLQTQLANALTPGQTKRFKIYSANGQLSKEISITATQEGIDFLRDYHTKLDQFIIDRTRLDPPAVSDPTMEAQIRDQFQANHPNVKIVRTVITLKPWYITKNALGTTLYRDFYAQIAYHDANGTYFMQKLYCKSTYNGSGYDAMHVSERTEPQEMREANVF